MRQRIRRGAATGRREFIKGMSAAAGAIGLSALGCEGPPLIAEEVNRRSAPSQLRITDMRIATVKCPMVCPIIRLDTNQGLVGWGEVRDGASKNYALFLKSRLLGENPCSVERLFKKIKQFGHHGRQGGGVSGVEMALWDLAGKAYGVPVYQMLGGKYRDRIRIYCDTEMSPDPEVYARRMQERVRMGFTFLKMDLGIRLLGDAPGTITRPLGQTLEDTRLLMHPFTAIEVTQKGIERLAAYVARIREAIGYEVPLAADHFGHIGVNSCIRLGKALEPYQMAWLEDMIPWQLTEQWQEITRAIDVPTLTGEDIYLKEEFARIVDARAVDIIHPDLATAGGILETKRIGDYAQERGVPMALHFAGTPVSCMASVHCAAATENFIALENHSVDVPWWNDLVTGTARPIVEKGFIAVPEAPGLGIDLDLEAVKAHLHEPGLFEPTPQWDQERSWDRLWS